MSNVSNRFTFRDGRTYLTGYPKWPGVHDLNDPIYGHDTLYIGPGTSDQTQFFIVGPSCTSYAPKISAYDDSEGFDDPEILTPGLHVFTYVNGRFEKTTPTDTPNILPTLVTYTSFFLPIRDAQAPKIIPVENNSTIDFAFQDNDYQPEAEFRPNFDITAKNPWTPTLLLPVGDFTAEMNALTNGYIIHGASPDPGAFVYIDGVEKKQEFSHSFTVPVLFEYGPRFHFQNSLGVGEHLYDTCYFFRSVNLTNTAIQPGDPR